jgi:hypothetical protein
MTGGLYSIAHESGMECHKGYQMGITETTAGGPGTTLPRDTDPWIHQMVATCFKTVTLPHVRLVGGPFDNDDLYQFIDADHRLDGT